jgi:hypothetical protein
MRRTRRAELPPKWEFPEPGRIQIEMDSAEYDTMRARLGPEFEYQGLVRMREGAKPKRRPRGSR